MSFLSRLRQSRIVQVVVVYLGASWFVVEAADLLQEQLGLPQWVVPVTIILLLVGLVVVGATAWVQGHPATDRREAAGEVPTDWELDLPDLARSLRSGRLPHLTWGRAALGGAGVVAIFVLVVLLLRGGDEGAPTPADLAGDSAAPGLAVLPFRTSGEGLDSWREGLVDLLSRNLDGLGDLRAIDSRTVLARWTEAVGPGASPDLATALAVASRTGARWALLGSAVETGSQVRVTADVYDVDSGRRLDGATAEGSPDSLLTLVDALSVDVARTLLEREDPDLSALRLSSITTPSPEALRLFLDGEAAFRRLDFQEAAEAYREAVDLDPGFALAYYRLAAALGWAGAGGEAERQRAYEHRERLPERERLMVEADYLARSGRLPAGVALLRQGVQRFPDDPEIWYGLGDIYIHFGPELFVTPEDGEAALRHAVALDPGFAPYRIHLVDIALVKGDSAEAARLLEAEAATASPDSRELRAHRLTFDYLYGSPAEKAAVLAALDTVPEPVRAWIRFPFTLDGDRAGDFLALENAACAPHMTDPGVEGIAQYACVVSHLANGRIADVERFGETSDNPVMAALAAFSGIVLRQTGMDPSAPIVDPAAMMASMDPGQPNAIPFYLLAGIQALETHQPALADSILRIYDRAVQERTSRGDTVAARTARAFAEGLRGYIALADGRADAARGHLDTAIEYLAGIAGPAGSLRSLLVWPLAGLDDDAGREQEALRFYRGLSLSVYSGPALLRRAEIHDQLGDEQRADELYAQFLAQWSGADPSHPMVQRARSELAPG